jgi:hypothetical protein
VISVCLTPILFGQSPARTFYIPALAYGPNGWSIVRLTNSSATRQTVRIEAFREDGTTLPLDPAYDVEQGATRDVRIEEKSAEAEMCWARVVLPEGVAARGYVEILQGNSLEDFPRELHELSDTARWVTLASRVEGKQMYFLNAASRATMVAFCAVKQTPPNACEKKGTRSARYRVGPNQSLAVQLKKMRATYFITESSVPGAAVLVLFDNGPGVRKQFGSNSSIEFGDAVK